MLSGNVVYYLKITCKFRFKPIYMTTPDGILFNFAQCNRHSHWVWHRDAQINLIFHNIIFLRPITVDKCVTSDIASAKIDVSWYFYRKLFFLDDPKICANIYVIYNRPIGESQVRLTNYWMNMCWIRSWLFAPKLLYIYIVQFMHTHFWLNVSI